MQSRIKIIVPFLIFFLMAVSCGYKFSGSGKLPDGVDAVYINVFKNHSSENGWEASFASELVSEFTKAGIKIVPDKNHAKSFLSGNIKSITSSGISHSSDSTTLEERFVATVDVKITDKSGTILWQKNSLTRSEEYTSDNSSTENTSKTEAMQVLAEDFAEYIASLITDNF